MIENIPWVLVAIISLGVFSAHCLLTLGFILGMSWKALFGSKDRS